MTPATTAITEALPPAQQGVASSMNDLARELGGALGIAVIGSVLASAYRANLHLTDVAAAIAAKASESVALATHIGGPIAANADLAYADGLRAALLVAAAVVAVAAVAVAVLLPSRDTDTH